MFFLLAKKLDNLEQWFSPKWKIIYENPVIGNGKLPIRILIQYLWKTPTHEAILLSQKTVGNTTNS